MEMVRKDALSAVAGQKERGAKVIGCFPLYPPVELLAAMDLLPVVLWGLKGSVENLAESDKHVQAYACAIGRELMQFALSENHTVLDGIFSYNACDTLRNFPEIISAANAEAGREIPMLRMHVPQVNPDQTDSTSYLKKEIARLIEAVENAYGVHFSPEKFFRATEAYARVRALCRKAEKLVAQGVLSFGMFCRMVLFAYFQPVAEQIQYLESMVDGAEMTPDESKTGVVISGIMPPPTAVVAAMEAAGLRVVANDIACLSRCYGYSPPPMEDPGAFYADFFTNRPACTTLLYQSDTRVEAFLQMVAHSGARGVIFSGQKFCEYEYFEFPYLEKRLKDMGVSVLFLEFGVDDEENVDAYATRVEAFAEMLD